MSIKKRGGDARTPGEASPRAHRQDLCYILKADGAPSPYIVTVHLFIEAMAAGGRISFDYPLIKHQGRSRLELGIVAFRIRDGRIAFASTEDELRYAAWAGDPGQWD